MFVGGADLVGLLKVALAALGICFHGSFARPPPSWAYFAVLVGELEGLHEAESLVNIAADGQVIDGDLTEVALIVNDEKPTEGNSFILLQDSIPAGNVAGLISQQGDLHLSETTLFAFSLHPCEMAEMTIS